ncbi:MAG TPA: hypothetical protein VMS77_06735 [Conexivisphaerales archaeon]|nr:hypothetical protein [Conexivisphaerales archaeon]
MTRMPSLDVLAWYLVALVVASHGMTYTMFATLNERVLVGWRGSSWLLGTTFTGGTLRTLALALWVVTPR